MIPCEISNSLSTVGCGPTYKAKRLILQSTISLIKTVIKVSQLKLYLLEIVKTNSRTNTAGRVQFCQYRYLPN